MAGRAVYYRDPELRQREVERRKALRPNKTESHYRSVYGINFADYNRMLVEQGGRCAICRSERPSLKAGKRFVVDHCHTSGAVRGLLCLPCNQGLGCFRDNDEALTRAAAYLLAAQKRS